METVKIKSCKFTNFESHADSEFEFHEGFNAVVGPSCSGKTSISRALRSVTVPRGFSQGWVREGYPFCTIRFDTNVGWLMAKKGEGVNEFTYFIDGETPKEVEMTAPGEKAFEIAKKILGIETIRIESAGSKKKANNRLDVNMMRQSNPEGLLGESGKDKAFIFDLLCGIEDSEGIREGLKSGINERKKKNDELVTALTQIRSGAIEEKKLQDAREEYNGLADDYDVLLIQKKNLTDILDSETQHNLAVVSVTTIEHHLTDPTIRVPERAIIEEFRCNSPKRVSSLQLLSTLHQKHTTVGNELVATQKALDGVITVEASTIEGYRRDVQVLSYIERHRQAEEQVGRIGRELALVGDVGDVRVLADLIEKYRLAKRWYDLKAESIDLQRQVVVTFVSYPQGFEKKYIEELIEKISLARELYKRRVGANGAVVSTGQELEVVCNTLASLVEARRELLDKVIVCPVTGKGIGEKCSLWEEKQK